MTGSLSRAIPNTEEQQEVLERAVRATEDEETGCEFIKEAHRLVNDEDNEDNEDHEDHKDHEDHEDHDDEDEDDQ